MSVPFFFSFLFVFLLFFSPCNGGASPIAVYGQNGNFSSNVAGAGNTGLRRPTGIDIDSTGVYIADFANNRVLWFSGTATTASRVYGQSDFNGVAPNAGGISASSLNRPFRAVADGAGNLYIVDSGNSRILFYDGNSTVATRVYGQGGLFTTGAANFNGVTATSLNQTRDMAINDAGNLIICDTGNHRVLFFNSVTDVVPSRVYGQGGSFTSATPNRGGVSSSSLNTPQGVSPSALGSGLFIGKKREKEQQAYFVVPGGVFLRSFASLTCFFFF